MIVIPGALAVARDLDGFGGLVALGHASLTHVYRKVAVYEPGVSPRTE